MLLDQDLQRRRVRRSRCRVRGAPQGRRRHYGGGVGLSGRRGGQGAFLRRSARPTAPTALGRTPSGPQARARQVFPPHFPLLPSQNRGRRLRAARHPRNVASRAPGSGRGSHSHPRGLNKELKCRPADSVCKEDILFANNTGGELGEEKGTTEYAIKQVGDRYYPVIVDREAGGHYEINNPLTGGVLSYKNPEAAEKYIQRAREKR